MRYRLLKSKIHCATVTETQMDYPGSITIDEDLMDASGIVVYEQVLVANLANGTRHETYVVKGDRGTGVIRVMGAAAHLVNEGDRIIIMAFGDFAAAEIEGFKAKIVVADANNKIARTL